jgi:FkbM family methyltransferase
MRKKAFKYAVLQWLQRLGFVRRRTVTRGILGKQYRVIEGTIRDYPEKDECWLFNLAANHRVIIDVGSNIGQSAMLMLYHEAVEKIVLVDPNAQALSFAAENLIVNNLSAKAFFIPAFLSDRVGENVEFYTVLSGAAGSKFKSFARTAGKLDSHFTVPTLTVDSLCHYLSLKPDLVKVDVEGAEIDVLNGAVELANNASAKFIVEIHSGPDLGIIENTNNILKWCQNHGYSGWYLKDKNPLSIDSIKARGGYHALLMSQYTDFPEYLNIINESDKVILV